MGVTGGLVRSIFFRNKSFGTHDYTNNGRSNLGEKKRWSSVRSYLCGDEFNSVLAVDDSGSIKDSLDPLLTISQQLSSDSVLAIQDSASVKLHQEEDSVSGKNSEVSVTQHLHKEEQSEEATETHIPKRHHQTTLISKLFLEEDAAIIIQSAFRSYLAKRGSKEVEETFDKEESEESQGKVSMGTSLEVQTCSSVKAPFLGRKRVRTLHKNNTQVLRIKEEWDDSTVSSTISKSRIQSRIEAMTKRERALAYAFSQQLRICTKKKQVERNSEDESNIGWSWLERWMATRAPEIEARTNIQANVTVKSQRLVRKNRSFSTSIGGELESCASNDIPLQFESISEEETEDLQREKSSVKASKSVPSYKNERRHNRLQARKKDMQQQTKKAKTAPKMGNEHEETSRKINSSS
ncbi:PREDICTED: protein IQ-DOMAIN 1 [Brassica oleracea var. oleracea]|uniref:protein IQ-DOMAIN 1 n=1 Tax=Brassica oleracea var. oleracea TaxID=109376 RepID=UPI0006A70FB3|nr:PREDICTED: protein IQ-DOMAIN 1 [Brassica oleracea var. oleracea]